MSSELRLRPLRPEDEHEARLAHAEFEPAQLQFLLLRDPAEPWAAYLDGLEDLRLRRAIPDGMVPATFLVATVGDRIVGRASIRFSLNEYLRARGGHIGYGVRPADRRRGYATEILRQSLVVARAEGVDRVLVTCDDDNLGSIKAIERNGGILEDVRDDPVLNTRLRRYWID